MLHDFKDSNLSLMLDQFVLVCSEEYIARGNPGKIIPMGDVLVYALCSKTHVLRCNVLMQMHGDGTDL